MNTNVDRSDIINRFLNGEMEADELIEFEKKLRDDRVLRKMFDDASAIESVLCAKNSVKAGKGSSFEKIVTRSIASHALPVQRRRFMVWHRVYAIAASLIIMIMGGYIAGNKFNGQKVAASSNVKSKGPVADKSVLPGKSIMRLTPHAVYLAEEGTKSKIIRQSDSGITVAVSQGNICFDVHDHKKQPITVATPHTAIILSEAVTKVVVTELETEVSVLEGTVQVVHRFNSTIAGEFAAGVALYADYRSFDFSEALTSDVCDNRKSVFRAYIAWVQKQAHG